MFHSVWFYIWAIGFCVMSPFALFAWAFGCAIATDSTNKWFVIRTQLWITFVCFVMTWLWPIGLPIFLIAGFIDDRKIAKKNAAYEEKLSQGKNYGKKYRVVNVPKNLESRMDKGYLVKIISWDDERPLIQCVGKPLEGYDIGFRFYFPLENMIAV